MTMNTVYFKEHEGVVQNSTGSVTWWSGLGSQSAYSDTFGNLRASSMEHRAGGDQFTANKPPEIGSDQGLRKGNSTEFTLFSGNCKSSEKGQKSPQPHDSISMQSAMPENRGRFELEFGQPMICAKYPYGDQCYGVLSTYGSQIMGRIMLPLNFSTDDGPIYVNAKQYHGIMRRRQSRAKAELGKKGHRTRKQPYLHLSRHLHAMRRPRGCGGRFLNTKTSNCDEGGIDTKKAGDELFSQCTESQISEVLQSNGGNLNSPKESSGGGSNLSGSEVTSVYSRVDFDFFPINHNRPPVHFLSNMTNTGHGGHGIAMPMPNMWVATADSCCRNLKV